MKAQDKISLFKEIFKGRQDIAARYWKSVKTGRCGYAPICRNEWKSPRCRKKSVKNACNTCVHADYIPLSDALIYDHFTGKHILGIYPLLSDHTCYFIAADFDNHNFSEHQQHPLEDAAAFYEVCQVQEIPCYLLRSKSGNGYHAFMFFEMPVPARKARQICFALLEEADVISDETQLSSFDRLFPNQDNASGKGFGNLIALPFQGNAAKKGHTLFLNPDTAFEIPYKNQWKVLAEIEKISEDVLDQLISDWGLNVCSSDTEQVKPYHQHNHLMSHYPAAEFGRIARKCRFIAHCRDDAKILPEPDWYILLTITARCKDGKGISHALSAPYPDYTPEETEAKINQALNNTGPYRCQTIKRINGTYCKSCKYDGRVKSPIVLGWEYPMRRKTEWEVETPEYYYGRPPAPVSVFVFKPRFFLVSDFSNLLKH